MKTLFYNRHPCSPQEQYSETLNSLRKKVVIKLPLETNNKIAILDKNIFFDTGVIKNCFKNTKPENEVNFWNSVNNRSYTRSSNPYFVSTALMSTELLGFRLKDIDPYLADSKLQSTVISTFKNMSVDTFRSDISTILKTYIDWLQGRSELALDNLRTRNQKEIAYRSPWAKGLMDSLVGGRLRSEPLREGLLQDIAYDRIQSVPYHEFANEEVTRKLDLEFLVASLISLSNERSNATCRFTDSIIARALKKKHPEMSLPQAYEPEREALDTEIVYYSIVGQKNATKDRYESVAVFSTEQITSWKQRIQRYIGVIRYLDECKRKTSGPLIVRPGLIVQVSDKAEIVDIIDVKSEFDFTDLVCDQDLRIQNWNLK